jgi:multidrug efflux pump subunit AcrB
LPADVRLTIEQQTPAVFPVLSFNVIPGATAAADPVARARLAEWAELDLKARIARLPDTFSVTVQSGDVREYVFEADPVALAQAGVDLLAVKDALAAANAVAAVGRSAAEGLQYQLLVDGRITEPDQILELAVRREGGEPLRLADLGRLVETVAERTMVVTGGGADGVVVSVFLRDGGKVTRLSAEVARIVAEVQGAVPSGGRIEMVYDQAQLVDDSIAGVRDAIALGALLSVAVIAIFLGDWRITVVAGLAIPISVLLTIAAFPLVGESLNLMSLGGLAVAIGLIIDDAIVVVENVARRARALPAGASRRETFRAVSEGTGEVLGAIVGSSLTTVVVFLPLVLLEGVVGQFFASLSLALGISILASMVVSLVYTPLMLLAPALAPSRTVRARRWTTRLQDAYAALAARMLAHPGPIGLALVACALLGAAGLRGIRTGFLPEMDEGGFVLDYALPVGSSLAETDAVCRRIEAVLIATPEVASLSRRTGAELGFFATEQFTGDMLVGLEPRARRARSVFAVMDELRERLAREVPQAEVEFIQVMQDTIADLAGNPDPLEVKLLGAEYGELQRAADDVERALGSIPGVVDVKNHVSFGSPELAWRPDPLRAARAGLSTEQIAAQASAQLLGEVATRIPQGDRFVDVRVRYPEAWRADGTVEGGRAAGARAHGRRGARPPRFAGRVPAHAERERARAREPEPAGARDGRPCRGATSARRAVRSSAPCSPSIAAGRACRVRRPGREPGGGVREPAARVRSRRRARVPVAGRPVPLAAPAVRDVPRAPLRPARRTLGAAGHGHGAEHQLRHGPDHARRARGQEWHHHDRVRAATAARGSPRARRDPGVRPRPPASDPDDDVRGDRRAAAAGAGRRRRLGAAASARDRGHRRPRRLDDVHVIVVPLGCAVLARSRLVPEAAHAD